MRYYFLNIITVSSLNTSILSSSEVKLGSRKALSIKNVTNFQKNEEVRDQFLTPTLF